MPKLPILNPGDTIEIIAPASRCTDKVLSDLKELLSSWQLKCVVDENMLGDDLLCANSDENRFRMLKNALENRETKAIICVRGGYGSLRLIPALSKMHPPKTLKLFIGMSDITALSLYFQQNWGWPTLHASAARDKFSPKSIERLKSIIFGENHPIEFMATALNNAAQKNQIIETTITGGNLSIVQTSIGTLWQIDGRQKIIFLEEVGERGYRIDRMLEHLKQAGIFKEAVAILFGDFTEGNEPDGTSLVQPVLERFAQASEIPVVQIKGVGHGYENFPLPLGVDVKLHLGNQSNKLLFQ